MKWIVKSDFYRTPELEDVQVVDACKGAKKEQLHANHFSIGQVIELGKMTNESELQTGKDPQKTLIAQLRYSGRIGDASDKDVVKRVEQDVDTANKRAATLAKANERVDNDTIVNAILAKLNPATAAK